jgi:hypothetical protein
MRGIDSNMAIAVRNHWQGIDAPGVVICPLLADLDKLLEYLDAIELTPGHAICPCLVCGGDHRWVLIKRLMMYALDVRPARHSKLLSMVDGNLEPVRELYGGEEGARALFSAGEEFFAKVDAIRGGKHQ